MKEIVLTKNKVVIVDNADFKWLNSFKWCFDSYGYAVHGIRKDGKKTTQRMHALIMKTPKGMDTDHINGNGLDNRRCDLRVVSHAQNLINRKKNKSKLSTIFKGINWNKTNNMWEARIGKDGLDLKIGYFHNEIAAAMARDIWARHLYGNIALLNFPDALFG